MASSTCNTSSADNRVLAEKTIVTRGAEGIFDTKNVDGIVNSKDVEDTFYTDDLAEALSRPSMGTKDSLRAHFSSSNVSAALKAKQEKRKFRGSTMPDPNLGVPLDDFTLFTQFLKSSKRIFALIGAGLSVASDISTYRGDNRHWRGIEPADLSNIAAFWKDPVKVWLFWSTRMKRA